MLEKIRKNLKSIIGYVLLGGFFYFVMLYFTLPYELILDRVIGKAEEQLGLKLEVKKVSPSLPLGFTAKGVELSKRGLTGSKPLKIASLKITTSIIGSMLYPFTKRITATIKTKIGKGTIKSKVISGKKSGNLDLSIKSLNLESIKTITQQMGLDVSGKISGTMLLATEDTGFDNFNLRNSIGETTLKTSNLSIKIPSEDGTSVYRRSPLPPSVKTALSLVPFTFKKLDTEIVLNKGLVEIKNLSLEREGLSGKISGVLKLEKRMPRSVIDLGLNLRLSEDEKIVRPLLALSGERIGCPIRPDNTVSCKINGTLRDLSGSSF